MRGNRRTRNGIVSQGWRFSARAVWRAHRTFVGWWRRNDRRYGVWWRVANIAAAFLMILSVILPIAQQVLQDRAYRLDANTLKLVGKTDQELAKNLTYDSSAQAYQFNTSVIQSSNDNNIPTSMEAQIGNGTDGKRKGSLYGVEVSEQGSKGVRYYDANSGSSFGLVPQFSISTVKEVDGHLVYLLDHGAQAIYTLKNNGLKEDIVLQKATQDTLSFRYKLDLPKTLAMKTIPNSGGAVGVYSADPALTNSNISYGSDADRVAVQKARENAEKNYLVFGLPSPVIKNTQGQSVGSARFELTDTTLTIVASGLTGQTMPVSIDPSVVVTSTTDFQYGGNDEGMISFTNTSNQITRGGLTGGTVGSWSSANSLTNTVESASSATYNGYVYQFGGYKRTATAAYYATVNYAAINADGTLGTWQTTTSLPATSSWHQTVAYDGYMYVLALGGGSSNYYTRINSDGTLGLSWTQTTSFSGNIEGGAAVAYNGYMYMLGGSTGSPGSCGANSNCLNTSYYAPINGDGTLGAWGATTVLNRAEAAAEAVAYNGYMYISGGSGSAAFSNVDYAHINADGTLGAWTALNSMIGGRYAHIMYAYNGYMYIAAGYQNRSDVQYALINANGTLGTWLSTTSLPVGVTYLTGASYNGYLYAMTGYDGTNDTNSVYYAKIDPAGEPNGFTTTSTAFGTARALACSVAYNGYLYVIGGSTTDTSAHNVANVDYAPLNATTGQAGTWASTTALPVATGSLGCTVAGGRLYVMGGYTGTKTTGTGTNAIYYISIGSTGALGASWTTGSSSGLNSVITDPRMTTYTAGGSTYIYAITAGSISLYSTTITVSTGANSAWTTVNAVIPDMSAGTYAAARVGNYLYMFGGATSSAPGTALSVVYYSAIANDGSASAWQTTTSMNTAISYTNGTSINGCIYSVGGETGGGTSLNTVQYACPNSDGTISTWYTAPSLSVATTDMAVTSYGGYIYGAGGWTTAATTATQFSFVNNGGNGSTGTWSDSGATISCGRNDLASVAYNGYLYVGGGNCSGTIENDVQYAAINANGSLGAFAATSSFTNARVWPGMVAYNGYMYIVGGCSNTACATYYNDVQRAAINANGTLSTFGSVGGSYATNGRKAFGIATYNGYMYITGGTDSVGYNADTRYAAINSDGTLGTWASAGSSFTNGRMFHGTLAYGGYLYILGGYDGTNYYNDVQYAPINSNGTIGTWIYTANFNGLRREFSAAVMNGFMYIYGGYDGTNYLGDVQYAPIHANGTLTIWQASANVFSHPRSSTGSAASGGNIYIVGGYDPLGSGNDVQYAPVLSLDRTARYSKLIDLGAMSTITSITYNGTLPNGVAPGVVPITYQTLGSSGAFGTANPYTYIAPTANGCDTTSQSFTRYIRITIVLDDSSGGGAGGMFADANGTNANSTDVTINYRPIHPAPNIRLRAGRFLQQGNLSPLDTCYP